jgi:uncharacterized protein YbbC (DUF1343 family)
MTGLDVLRDADFAPLRGKRVGLVTHPAALDTHLRSAADLFAERTNLVALFGPEHGITGEAQDLIPVGGGGEGPARVYSLYGDTFDSLKPTPAMLDGLDVLVIDLQDVGSRYYTFQATMLYCLEACAAVGLPVVVLDRPNPLGGREVEGPTIRPGFESFVGPHPICTRHGMTIGELATLYKAERVPGVNLAVIRHESDLERGDYDWLRLPPSPNMPTFFTASVYPGMCLIEGTNLSEGRGTTRPFEYVGFPGVNPKELATRLNASQLEGVTFIPVHFRPTFQKHAGQTCGGVFVSPSSPAVQPVRTGLAVLVAFRNLLGDAFRWRTETYEFVDHIPAIDLLFGSDRERLAIESGASWQDIAAAWEPEEAAFRERRKPHLLYPE